VSFDPAAPRRDFPADLQIASSALLIALGSLLLSLQYDHSAGFFGTGLGSLGIAAVVALFTTALRARHARIPRELVSIAAAVLGFAGLTFAIAGVLVPSGAWLFCEVLVLLWVLSREKNAAPVIGPHVTIGGVLALALMLLFRLWVTYQWSVGHLQVMSLDVPILSSIPFAFLDPLKTIPVGSFKPEELGIPPTVRLDFQVTAALWTSGFVACVAGLAWLSSAAREHENDRIHTTIRTLPTALANLVERLLPEEDWVALGLHGLSERMLCKRIEALVQQRLGERRDFDSLLRRTPLLSMTNTGGFAGEIQGALTRAADGAAGVAESRSAD
jgi:hypothetical protein